MYAEPYSKTLNLKLNLWFEIPKIIEIYRLTHLGNRGNIFAFTDSTCRYIFWMIKYVLFEQTIMKSSKNFFVKGKSHFSTEKNNNKINGFLLKSQSIYANQIRLNKIFYWRKFSKIKGNELLITSSEKIKTNLLKVPTQRNWESPMTSLNCIVKVVNTVIHKRKKRSITFCLHFLLTFTSISLYSISLANFFHVSSWFKWEHNSLRSCSGRS